MLYIFRYFKEKQKSIFVIKTMFAMVQFDWLLLCERNRFENNKIFSYLFSLE